jgi:prepilin-type N-terminal cleavage/methylation domain-containing protein
MILSGIDLQSSNLELRSSSSRRAYTLLEIVVATAIFVILVAALYAAMEMQLRHMQAGRDVTEQSGLARALLARMSSDIMHSLTPVAPVFYPSSSSLPNSTGTGSNATTSSSSSSSPTTDSTFQFDLGLQGDKSQLTLFSCGLPSSLTLRVDRASGELASTRSVSEAQSQPTGGDLRFITYWIAQSNQEPLGLARLELKRVTADEAGQVPASGSAEEAACVIAEEVKGLEFRYLDRSGWNASWDGTSTGSDLLTLIGPPRAIEIRLSMLNLSQDMRTNTKPELRVYRHVVAVPTAPR